MPQDPAVMRASDADRERAAGVLKEAAAEGRLRPEEYEDRLGAALTAQTYGELDRLVEDLPARPAAGAGQALAPAGPGAWAGTQAPAPPQDRVNNLAVGALVAGVAGVFTAGVGGLVAVILGHLARGQIRATGERGSGLATTGMVLGYVQVAMAVLALVGLTIAVAAAGGDGPAPPPPQAP